MEVSSKEHVVRPQDEAPWAWPGWLSLKAMRRHRLLKRIAPDTLRQSREVQDEEIDAYFDRTGKERNF